MYIISAFENTEKFPLVFTQILIESVARGRGFQLVADLDKVYASVDSIL